MHGSHEKGGDIAVAPRSPDFDPSALPRRGVAVRSGFGGSLGQGREGAWLRVFGHRGRTSASRGTPRFRPRRPAQLRSRNREASHRSCRSGSPGVPRNTTPAGRFATRLAIVPKDSGNALGYRLSRFPLAVARATAARRRVDLHPTGSNDRFPNGTNHHDPIVSF